MLLVAAMVVVLVLELFPFPVRLSVAVGSVSSSWACHPSVGGAGRLVTCPIVLVDVSVVSSAFQRLCLPRISIVVGLCGRSPV